MAAVARSGGDPGNRDETLALITHAAAGSIPCAVAVSITLRRSDGRYETVAATGDLSVRADRVQYDLGEGPCIDAADGRELVHSQDVPGDRRYLRYGPKAAHLGVGSQLSYEMFIGYRSFGGLNVYARSDGAFGDEDTAALAQLFACQAAAAMRHAARDKRLSSALTTRRIIGQATGLVMERYGLDERGAFNLMARSSRSGHITLRQLAEDIVNRANDKPGSQAGIRPRPSAGDAVEGWPALRQEPSTSRR